MPSSRLRALSDSVPSAVRGKLPGLGVAGPVLLELDLSRGVLETAPGDPMSALRARRVPTLRQLTEQLRRAASDKSVAGLVGHVGPDVLTAAEAQELGAAVETFAATGRPTACWTESFGELGPGTVPYLFAAYFDEVWLAPSGSVSLLGVSDRGVFLRDALDRLGLEPQLSQRHEYKNAADLLLRSSMTEPHRQALQRIADSTLDQVVVTAARTRSLPAEQVRAAIDASPLTARQALEAGLVDRLGYRDELYDDLRRRLSATGHLTLRYAERWSPTPATQARERVRQQRQPTIAVVPVTGAITTGRSGSSPLTGMRAGSDTVTAALRAAGKRDDVRAVVLRVVSPGGSYVASDAIRAAVLRLRDSGRPVVASMGWVAASGGYFVAMPCAEVIATPTTVTGSIGVLGGKVVIRDALRRMGIGVESVSAGAHAAMFAPERRFDEEEWARVERWLDDVYDDFTHKAAADRQMPYERLEPLARGRVWTGSDALERGLVDRLGGLQDAARRAAELAGVPPDRIKLRTVPRVTPLDRLRPPQSSETPTAAAWGPAITSAAPSGPEGLLRTLLAASGAVVPGVLTLPGSWDLR